jgi:hypothetical protein
VIRHKQLLQQQKQSPKKDHKSSEHSDKSFSHADPVRDPSADHCEHNAPYGNGGIKPDEKDI